VAAGAGLLVLEAMKMENELRATAAGVVTAVRVSAGQTVEKGQVLVELE
jgi:biotin carboxyl carrier protein